MADLVDKIIRYESGEMTQEEEVNFFQELIDSGDCWKLQGHYGRTAMAYINMGLCHRKGDQDAKASQNN